MSGKSRWYWVVVLALAAAPAAAQQLQFTNGDQLSGRWIKVEGTTLDIDTELFGNMSIPISKVGEFIVAEPLVLVTKSGQIETANRAVLVTGTWELNKEGRSFEIPADQVATIVPGRAYHQVMVETSPRPWLGWHGAANFGFSLQRGDQDSRTTNVSFNAVRSEPHVPGLAEHWRTTYSLQLLFANAQSEGVQLTSNSLTTSLRQDYFFRPNEFVFALGQADHLGTQNLYLRQTYGGGLGRDIRLGNRFRFSLLAGATFDNEKFTNTPATQSGEALIGEHGTLQFTRFVQLQHSLNFYPNLSNSGQYRLDTNTTIGFQLIRWLSTNLTITDFYISRIPTGAVNTVTTIGPNGQLQILSFPVQNNNLTLTAGVGFHF